MSKSGKMKEIIINACLLLPLLKLIYYRMLRKVILDVYDYTLAVLTEGLYFFHLIRGYCKFELSNTHL